MISAATWPNHPSRDARTAAEVVIKEQGVEKDVAWGYTKV